MKGWKKWVFSLFVFLLPFCLIGTGMATWAIAEINEKTNIMVQASDVTTSKISAISIYPNLASSSIIFDAELNDESGSVTSSNEQESQLDIKLTGYITSPKGEWTSIKTSLSLSGTNSAGESYQSIYNDLVNEGYIVHPTFDPLPNDGTYGTNNSKWTTEDLASNTWYFEVASSFAYGSIFGNMNPSVFFDSDTFNGSKKGSEYSKIEIRDMLARLQELDGAKYVITMRVLTETNASKLTLQSGETGAKGTFVTTNSSNNIVYEGMMSGDWVKFPEVYRSNYATDYYYLSGSTSHESDASYQFEVGRSYDFGTLLSTHGKEQGDPLTFLPHYTSTSTTLSVSCDSSGNPMTVNYAVAWYSSNAGTTTSSKNVSDNNSWTQTLNIGDVVSMSISGNSNIKYYTVSGFKDVSSSTQYTKSAYFTVEKANPTITITPYGNISIKINWIYAAAGTSQVKGDQLTNDAAFTLVTSGAESQCADTSTSFSVSEGATFSMSDYHGVSGFVVKDSNGNTVTASGGNYTAAEGMSIDVTVAPAIAIVWSISSTEANSTSTGPKLAIYSIRNSSLDSSSAEAVVNKDYASSTGNANGTYYASIQEKIYFTYNTGTSGSASIVYTSSNQSIGNIYATPTSYTQGLTVTVTGQYKSCLLPGTLISMADGSTKPVEEVRAGDMVKVFNHETGKLDFAPIVANDHMDQPEALHEALYLAFDNGTEIGISGEHGFFDLDNNRYEYIDSGNYEQFIGHRFVTFDGDDRSETRLVGGTVEEKMTKVYSPISYFHVNIIAENLLSVPGSLNGLFNIFEYDVDTLAYDEEKKAADIEKYGLFTYEDFKDLVPEEFYNAFPAKYFKVAIGKGLVTWEEILGYIDSHLQTVIDQNGLSS